MNNKGFTLIELMTVFVILSLIIGLGVATIGSGFGRAKEGTEDVFVGTIEDALDIYLDSSSVRGMLSGATKCSNVINKTHGDVIVYKIATTFQDVIDSEYKPITQKDLINPSNKEKCRIASNIPITIYRDADYVYYYSVNRSDFDCLTTSGIITNLPEGFSC